MSYARGRQQEYEAARWLEKQGWRIIGKFSGSKPVDLLARDGDGALWLVEVKYASGRLSDEDDVKLETLSLRSGLPILVLHRRRYGAWAVRKYFEPDSEGEEPETPSGPEPRPESSVALTGESSQTPASQP